MFTTLNKDFLYQVWSRSVGLVMEDAQLQTSKSQKPPSQDLGRIGELMVQRTPEWVTSTAEKLCVLLKKITSCTSAHLHWRVRLELVELADHLLATCSQSLKQCVGPLLEALVGAINDEEPKVRERFVLIVSIFVKKSNTESLLKLVSSSEGAKLLSEKSHRGIRAAAAMPLVRTSPTSCPRTSTPWPPPCPD